MDIFTKTNFGLGLVPEEMVDFLLSHGIDSMEKLQSFIEPNLYAIIPVSILERPDMSANAKLLYAEINALAKKSGVCFATNEYLGDRLGLSRGSMKKIVKELSDKKLVRVDITKNKKGTWRRMFVEGGVGLKSPTGEGQTVLWGGAGEPLQKRVRERELEKEITPFSVFWTLYPKKVERKKTELKWTKLTDTQRAAIMADLPNRCQSDQWKRGYIPNPMTYLNGERWLDEFGTKSPVQGREVAVDRF